MVTKETQILTSQPGITLKKKKKKKKKKKDVLIAAIKSGTVKFMVSFKSIISYCVQRIYLGLPQELT